VTWHERAPDHRSAASPTTARVMADQAERYKSQGNQALQQGQYKEAIELYTKAIALEPSEPVYFSNRAAAYAALKRWREALDDSQEVVTLKPAWVKGWVRRGAAFTGLGKHEEARKAYLKASQLEPGNAQIEQHLKAAERAAKEDKEKNWENDLWSDDDDDGDAAKGSAGGSAAAGASSSAGTKRSAEEQSSDAVAPKRARRKPSREMVAQLDRSLKDASEDSLRACLGQIAMADDELAERVLHILEGLNAASSAGEDDDEDDEDASSWLRAHGSGAGASAKARRRQRDSDSD